MAKKGQLLPSIYDGFDKDDRGVLIYLAAQLKKDHIACVEAYFELSRNISEAHEIHRRVGKEGQFTLWVETQTPFSRRTAYNILSLKRLSECNRVAQLEPEEKGQFEVAALYELARPDVPQKVIQDCCKAAKKGRRVSREDVKDLIEVYAQENSETGGIEDDIPDEPDPPEEPEEPDDPPADDEPAEEPRRSFPDEIKPLCNTIINVRKKLDEIFERYEKSNTLRESVMKTLDEAQIEMGTWK